MTKHSTSSRGMVERAQTATTGISDFTTIYGDGRKGQQRTFLGIVVGDAEPRSRRSIKLELKEFGGRGPNIGRMWALVSGGHKLAVRMDWTPPEFNRTEGYWIYKAIGVWFCLECPVDWNEKQ
ncbi:hypothetical protein BJ508DRAFT_332684 [Ascobolus immersus RN42]|uniref:Uncharacterized protein n=1 Tax=Ascobolus immersus RN42 TaxID=1160509 RepID=A0A3N4HLY3_ASCIM|nr:hypothetical protein BJ508DRAFT_332684 [Ascobolus immersus RN42]